MVALPGSVGWTHAERQWERFLAPLDHKIFESQASALRSGHSCEIEIPKTVDEMIEAGLFNQCNGHFPVLFDDGVKWLLRIRQITKQSATGDMQRIVTASEAETMRVLNKAGLLVPNAWTIPDEERVEFEPGERDPVSTGDNTDNQESSTITSSSSVPRVNLGRSSTNRAEKETLLRKA